MPVHQPPHEALGPSSHQTPTQGDGPDVHQCSQVLMDIHQRAPPVPLDQLDAPLIPPKGEAYPLQSEIQQEHRVLHSLTFSRKSWETPIPAVLTAS